MGGQLHSALHLLGGGCIFFVELFDAENVGSAGKIQYLSSPIEKAMAPHSSTPAWKIPRTEEPGRLQSMGSLGVGVWFRSLLSLLGEPT